jgi:multiple sugar transport system substrate-binding protein
VLKLQPLWGDAAPFQALLERFEHDNPGVTVRVERIPNASDLAHQYYLTALEAGAADFDVLVADVIWVPELARAGWLQDLSDAFPPQRLREAFLPGPVDAVVQDGRTYAVPWYVDVGLLYFRSDWVEEAPRTYDALVAKAKALRAEDSTRVGYAWQGRQYEGLSCNVFEVIWGHGGALLAEGDAAGEAPAAARPRLRLETPEAIAALTYLRGLITSGVSPASVTSAAEEESRLLFQQGRAAFLRNWPYAWAETQQEGSALRGKVGVAPLPHASGRGEGVGTLGGWQLALNRHSPPEKRAAALALLSHLTSLEANRVMAVHYARNPARRAAYDDPGLQAQAPFIAGLRPLVERARPRPVTPYYNLVADIVQGELSAAISGIRSPQAALHRAQVQVDRLMGTGSGSPR